MKTKELRTASICFIMLLFCAAISGGGCDKNKQNSQCFQGKVVSINKGDGCNYIIEIQKTDKNNSMLIVGSRITFDPKLLGNIVELGDIIYFRVIEYEIWEGPATTDCIWPNFIGTQIEVCEN
jgi:hypothetical protein